MKSPRFALPVLIASLALFCQTGAYGQPRDRPLPEGPGESKSAPQGGAAMKAPGRKSRPTDALTSRDRKFMEDAALAGHAQVEAAKLALSKSTTDAVKKFAQHMIDEHSKANEELKQIAAQKGVKLPTGPDATHRRLLSDMRAFSGAGFDRRYMAEAGVKDHLAAQRLFQNAEENAADADLKAFAIKTLPAIKKHLEMAKEIAGTSSKSSKKL